MGYDGKGQRKVTSITDIKAALEAFSSEVIFEAFVPFTRELSVIVARNSIGDSRCFPVVENRHVNHILDLTIDPAREQRRAQTPAAGPPGHCGPEAPVHRQAAGFNA